jgi:glycine/D-amino acid oxidase-like deaminating enzyme
MDLRTGHAFWPISNGLISAYPPLEADLRCEVAVIGGGITGALVSHHLIKAGFDVVVLDKRDVAAGSTSASTALLQYEIDTHLVDLKEMIGEAEAQRAYWLCHEAIGKLEAIAGEVGDCGFQRKPSLYFASRRRDVPELKAEYDARRKLGIRLEFWSAGELEERFHFRKPAALYSHIAAEVDPYRLAHKLLCQGRQRGLRVFDRTEVDGWRYADGRVVLKTSRGFQVTARHLVFATGYEAEKHLKQRLATLRNSYALVSEPLESPNRPQQALIWESARPYLYIRTTVDGRVMVGGEDENYATLPLRSKRIPYKRKRLERRFAELFPDVPLETAFAWAGTFGETKDGLAYIGQTAEVPQAHFALGYGGNGITYSLVAAEIIRDALLGKDNPDRHIFRFDR